MRVFKFRASPGVLIGAIGVIVGLGGIALAAIPDSGGVIHGCYQKQSGKTQCFHHEQHNNLDADSIKGELEPRIARISQKALR